MNREFWLNAAKQVLADRIQHAEKAMKRAQEAANSEEKSSAGDKYETARAMGQLERDMHARQLDQALKEMQMLERLPAASGESIQNGSLVQTSNGAYFLSIGLGKLEFGKENCILLSAASPLGKLFIGKKAGEEINWNKETITIEAILS
ncbi:MAG: 3-oxoacyl-ACP synthase [Bacteroidetes bacterium]|nr:MAG: 3-oxoacyl-ACP synthase [Bacteroidota bacterium]